MGFLRILYQSLSAFGISCALASVGWAEGKATELFVAEDLRDTGLIAYILPRFTLKHGVRVTIVDDTAEAAGMLHVEGSTPVFSQADVTYGLTVTDVADPHMARFAQWLTGEVGLRTVVSFKPDGEALFAPPVAPRSTSEDVVIEGDANRGAQLALQACGRCHVVGEINQMAGIGSTPSFAVLRSLEDWMERFTAFYALNPHPAFTVIPDVTLPFDETRPSPISPVRLTLEELENIVAYTATIVPADLGAPIAHQ